MSSETTRRDAPQGAILCSLLLLPLAVLAPPLAAASETGCRQVALQDSVDRFGLGGLAADPGGGLTAEPPDRSAEGRAGGLAAEPANEAATEPAPARPDPYAVFRAARAAVEQGDEAAEAAIERARAARPPLEAADEGDLHARLHLALTLRAQARALAARRQPGAARSLEMEAAEELAALADAARRRALPLVRGYALGHRAALYADAGREADALVLAERAVQAVQAVNDPEGLARWQGERGRILRRLDRRAEARRAYQAAYHELPRVRATLAVRPFLDLARPIALPLVDLLLAEAASSEEGSDRARAKIAAALDVLEGLRGAELRELFGDPCLAEPVRRSADAIAGALILHPVVLEDRVELIVGRAGELHLVRSPASPGSLVDLASRFPFDLTDQTTRRHLRSGEQLYEWLIRPIEPWLDEQLEALVVVPSGPLVQLPFAALRDARSDRYLVERVPLALTPSLELTDPRPLDPAHTRALVAGLTTEADGMKRLPAVEREIRAVGELFPGTTLEGERFTLERFESAFDRRPYGIVHIASHGSFSSRSEESYVLTHDRRMTIDRLAAIIGRARDRAASPVELLTLSTCESAVGDERAALGLAGVAIRAGARSALATFWSVNDEATAELVGAFYRALAIPGTSRAKALQRAQRALIGSEAFAHPSQWAAFVLVNAWL